MADSESSESSSSESSDSSSNQSTAETSRLNRQETFAANGGSNYFAGGSSSGSGSYLPGVSVADASPTAAPASGPIGSEAGAAFNQVGIGSGPSQAAGGGGISSADLKAAGSGLVSLLRRLFEARSFVANPAIGMAKLVYSDRENLGKPSPYGDSIKPSHNSGYSNLPAPNSFAATQPMQRPAQAAGPIFSSSYLASPNTAQGSTTQTQSNGGGAVVVAALALLAFAS